MVESFNLDEAVEGDILDVGCGYGPIGISIAAAYPDRTIEMIDINSRAVELSKENAASNGIANVKIYASDRFDKVGSNQFAAILTNPPIRAGKSVVHEILEEGYRSLVAGGELWVVIQKNKELHPLWIKWSNYLEILKCPLRKKVTIYYYPKRFDSKFSLC